MIHARKDYQRIQDPLGKIADDEPVFLLRAQDDFFTAMLISYMGMNEAVFHDTRPPREVQRILVSLTEHANLAREWRRTHKTKLPDMPESALRKEGDKKDA